MKSCLGMLVALLVLVAVLGTGAGIWYLSDTAEFARQEASVSGPDPEAEPAPTPEPE